MLDLTLPTISLYVTFLHCVSIFQNSLSLNVLGGLSFASLQVKETLRTAT